MDSLDKWTSSSFKNMEDGRRLFFPWGSIGRGYVISVDEKFNRIRAHLKTFYIIVVPLAVVVAHFFGVLGGIGLAIAIYGLWVHIECGHLPRSEHRYGISESLAVQAGEHSKLVLWLMVIASLGFLGIGLLIFILDPTSWVLGLSSVAFFGLCAFVGARMLRRKRQVSNSATGMVRSIPSSKS